MPKISIISDFRESFPTKDTNGKTIFNDHPRKQSIEAVCDSLKNKGYDCSIFGGVPELTAAFANNEPRVISTSKITCCYFYTDC